MENSPLRHFFAFTDFLFFLGVEGRGEKNRHIRDNIPADAVN